MGEALDVRSNLVFSETFDRASALHPGMLEVFACHLDEAVEYASHELSRVRADMFLHQPDDGHHPLPIDQAADEAMAWFPASANTIDSDVLSSLLTVDGKLNPTAHVVGWVQVWIGNWVWWGWRDRNDYSVGWDDVRCVGRTLYWADENRRRWSLRFSPYLATRKPDWPDWLIPGLPDVRN